MEDSCKIVLVLTVLLFYGGMSVSAQDTGVDWYKLEEAQELAKEYDKKVLVYAEASWCSYCKKMEQQVLSEAEVQKKMSRYFYPVRVDIESAKNLKFNGKQMTQQEFTRQMRVSGTPTFIFINQEGSVMGAQPGFIPKDIYQSLLTYIGTNAHEEIGFKEYLEQN